MTAAWSIARVTLREALAARLWTAPVLYVAVLAAAGLLLPSASPADRVVALLQLAVALDFGLVGLLLAAFCATTIGREFRTRQELVIAASPAGPAARVAGKAAGAALLALLLVAACSASGYLVLRAFAPAAGSLPPALRPARHAAGQSKVFAGPQDTRPRPLRGDEEFAAPHSARPAWSFDGAPAGPLRLSVGAELRQAGTTLEAGLVALVARRGGGEAVVHKLRLFGGEPAVVTVDPPGSGALAVVLHPVGSTLLHPASDSVRLETGRGTLLGNYLAAQSGVLLAVWLLSAVGLFFSATCSPRPALLYTLALGLACASLGPMRTFGRVLGEGRQAVAEVAQSFSQLGGEGHHEHDVAAGESGAAWSGLRWLLRALVVALPDLARHDHRQALASGVLIGPRRLLRDAVPAAAWFAGLVALGALGLMLTGREGRS